MRHLFQSVHLRSRGRSSPAEACLQSSLCGEIEEFLQGCSASQISCLPVSGGVTATLGATILRQFWQSPEKASVYWLTCRHGEFKSVLEQGLEKVRWSGAPMAQSTSSPWPGQCFLHLGADPGWLDICHLRTTRLLWQEK